MADAADVFISRLKEESKEDSAMHGSALNFFFLEYDDIVHLYWTIKYFV